MRALPNGRFDLSGTNRARTLIRRIAKLFGEALVILSILVLAVGVAPAQGLYGGPAPAKSDSATVPAPLQNVGFDQRLGQQIPVDAEFKDETGKTVKLSEYFNGTKPVVLALVYYECPMLCNQVLNGLLSSLKIVSFDVGKDFEVVTVSFDPRETPELAAKKKESYVRSYKREGAAEGWHFLTGDETNIKRLTDSVGFFFQYDQQSQQFVHAAGIMVLTGQAKIARYFFGIDYAPKDLKFGLMEASDKRIGNPVDKLLLYCYHYDPAQGKYGAIVMNFMKIGGIITLIGMAALILVLRRFRPGDISRAED